MVNKKETPITFLMFLLIALPLVSVSALTAVSDHFLKLEEINNAMETVEEKRNQHIWLENAKKTSEATIDDLINNVAKITREKRKIRLQLADFLRTEKEILEMGINPENPDELLGLLDEEKQGMKNLVRLAYVSKQTDTSNGIYFLLASNITASLGERTESSLVSHVLQRSRKRLISMLRIAPELPKIISDLRYEHESILDEYWKAQSKADTAEYYLHAGAPLQQQILETVAEVEREIAAMQSELARIDARLRRRAERALIEKGLRSPRTDEYTSGKIVGDPETLSWPAIGRISAGFYDDGYQKIFGVPHKGIDIAIPHGSNVYSAADGVVFLARDGGEFGYSYILVGHKGGTATLYGHMSEIYVKTGDDVLRGSVLGLSGGTPGTYGAGPMTTGAHLHLEVLQNGKHVDPILVLH